MVILAVDRGDRRTGLAACDKGQLLAYPVAVIAEENEKRLLKKVSEEAQRLGAELIVVGCPRNMDGSLGESARKCLAFAEKLHSCCGIRTESFDERLTTAEALRRLGDAGVYGRKRSENVDAAAAVIILEDYLSYDKNRKK